MFSSISGWKKSLSKIGSNRLIVTLVVVYEWSNGLRQCFNEKDLWRPFFYTRGLKNHWFSLLMFYRFVYAFPCVRAFHVSRDAGMWMFIAHLFVCVCVCVNYSPALSLSLFLSFHPSAMTVSVFNHSVGWRAVLTLMKDRKLFSALNFSHSDIFLLLVPCCTG